jgi:glycerol kinase
MKYILSIDQSTSATKAVLFNTGGQIVHRENADHKQIYPQSGWVEHDPDEIYINTLAVIKQVVENSKTDKNEIIGIAITNQRETVVVWDKHSGKPVFNAVVWQCNRGASKCTELKKKGLEKSIREKTGLIIDPYFSATGISWILDNVNGARQKADQGDLCYGTIDSWLIWNLTGGKIHATDHSNACRTMLYNINTLSWDADIHRELNIPLNMAPQTKFADEILGYTDAGGFFNNSIPIAGVLGDSHAALFGQNCFETGMGKATYGTGSSIMMNIGHKPVKSPEGLVTSIGFALKQGISYVFEGNIHYTGATIKWLQDDLKLIENASETESLARSVTDTDGVFFVPAFTGLGAPYWDSEARALICGISRGTSKAHIVRAALEAIAYQVKDLIDLMTQQAGIALKELRVDGGPVKNKFLMQFQADILNTSINRSNIEEASALGVAFACGLALGIYKDTKQISKLRTGDEYIHGYMPPEDLNIMYGGWKNAVKKALSQKN